MKKICLLRLAAVMLCMASCVKDNGNYSYTDVNELIVDLPTNYTRIYLMDTVVRIEPKFTQTIEKGESNLSFEWRHSLLSAADARKQTDIVSTDKYVDLTIHGTDTKYSHYYWLELMDHTTGLVYPYYTSVAVIKPFVNTWTVLHSIGGGAARLSAIEYLSGGEWINHLDVFKEFGYPSLTGAPVALGNNNYEQASLLDEGYTAAMYNTMYLITTNASESGVYAPWLKFRSYVPEVFVPQMVYNYSASYFDVSKTILVYKPNSDGGTVINDGRLFQGRVGMKWYEARIASSVTGSIYIDKALRLGRISIMYDSAGKRFLWYNHYANGSAPQSGKNYNFTIGYFHNEENKSEIFELDRPLINPPNPVSLKNIEHRVLHIGIGYQTTNLYQNIESFAIANGDDAKTYIYLFPTTYLIAGSNSNQTVKELKIIDTPVGLNENSCFASSTFYNNIVFYSSGNKVYRLDFSTGIATPVYEHNGGGVIAAMKMAQQEMSYTRSYDTEAYGFPDLNRSMGIAINRGDMGELAVINLDEAGSVIQTSVFDGFGTIKDICFLCDTRAN